MHAPFEKKLLRENHSQYVTIKASRKAIMRRSILEKIKKQTNESLKAYKK